MLAAFAILILVNLINVFIDAYKIKRLKKIYGHLVNFLVYGCVTAGLIFMMHMSVWMAIVFCINAFCNRQIFFDIPLNWRRNLDWDYVTSAEKPAALDWIERKIFGMDGRTPVYIYAGVLVVSTIVLL